MQPKEPFTLPDNDQKSLERVFQLSDELIKLFPQARELMHTGVQGLAIIAIREGDHVSVVTVCNTEPAAVAAIFDNVFTQTPAIIHPVGVAAQNVIRREHMPTAPTMVKPN